MLRGTSTIILRTILFSHHVKEMGNNEHVDENKFNRFGNNAIEGLKWSLG